jgi:hypothetical protein
MNPMIRVLVSILLVAGVNAGARADEKADAEIARLRSEITALIGPAVCANLVNCRIAALGVDDCGGPKEYLVYSWRSTEKTDLETKIAEYNFAQESSPKKDSRACVALPQPVAACVNGRCVLQRGR